MDLNYSAEDEAFRLEVRSFLENKFPKDIGERAKAGIRFKKDDYYRWHKALNEQGWVAPHWPTEHGGTNWTPVQSNIFDEECFAAGTPRQLPFGTRLVGPVIIHFGNDAQKERYLPTIRSGEEFWCQGFSEPGAGSDLASLKTRAVLEGDEWVVNGQKTWTTTAQYADWIFCLVRTNTEVKKQAGISFLLIDMKTPGISVRPIVTIDGDVQINEVFLEDVRVPKENLVGEIDNGWTYAKFLLGNERTGIAGVGLCKNDLENLKNIARSERKNGKPLIEDPLFQARLSRAEIDLIALELTNMRMLFDIGDEGTPGAIASVLKIRGSELQQRFAELQMEATGSYALPWQQGALEPDWNGKAVGPSYAAARSPLYYDRRKTTIYGGSTEVQKNIITKAILEL
jgi:alkylation response protein AidB-like acyl-CoA dehydrogenase